MRLIQKLFRAFSRPDAAQIGKIRLDALDLQPPPDWQEGDAAELRRFLNTDAGRSLGAALRHWVAASAHRAMRSTPDRLPWECGRAAGIEDAAAQIDSLARWPADPNDDSDAYSDSVSTPLSHSDAGRRPYDDLAWLHRQPGSVYPPA